VAHGRRQALRGRPGVHIGVYPGLTVEMIDYLAASIKEFVTKHS